MNRVPQLICADLPLHASQPEIPKDSVPGLVKPRAPINDEEILKYQRSRMILGLFAMSSFVILMTAASQLLPADLKDNLKEGVSAAAVMLGILEDERLLWWSLVGAFCGAWVNVGIFRPTTTEEVIWKWVTSFFCSILFVPWIIESMDWDRTPTVALAASGAGAIVGWGIIQALAPVVTALAASRLGAVIKAILGVKDEEKQKNHKKPRG